MKTTTTMNFESSLAFAREMDQQDPLAHFRQRFHIPQVNGKDSLYFCGNSLGLQPKSTRAAIDAELTDWAQLGVEGHFNKPLPWLRYHRLLAEPAARIVGALPHEVVIMNTLTVNLHLMMVSFYRPTQERFKIITEAGAFPSDQYALETQARFHGFDPEEAVIELKPRPGEFCLHTEDILQAIQEHKDSLALVMMGGMNYYTGQLFDMEAITEAAHKAGALAGFDLAHAAGNVVLKMHDWNVDFAVWCTYKYLNSGPGGTSGTYVHERYANRPDLHRFAGWWGHDEGERFQMKKGFKPMYGAEGWQLSNAQVLPMAAHKASLEIFDEAGGMEALTQKSRILTSYLEFLLHDMQDMAAHNAMFSQVPSIRIITPTNPAKRGCQLSLLVEKEGRKLFEYISKQGVIADWREPNVIRIAPTPLYNTFEDVYRFVQLLSEAGSAH
jgi:kynureninase